MHLRRQTISNFRWILSVVLTAFVGLARADINQWEYINPADPTQGKQPSAIVCPGGYGVTPKQGVNLQNLD